MLNQEVCQGCGQTTNCDRLFDQSIGRKKKRKKGGEAMIDQPSVIN